MLASNAQEHERSICSLELFLAFLIVCIHFPTFMPREIIVPVARIAVPLFFIISGYFVGKSSEPVETRAKRNLVGLFKYMIFVSAVSWSTELIMILLNHTPASEFFGFKYSYHLWFMAALFFIAVVHYLICRANLQKFYPYIAAVWIAVGVLLNYFPALGLGSVNDIFRRDLFFPVFFIVGFMVGQKNFQVIVRWKKIALLVAGIGFTVLQPSEHLITPTIDNVTLIMYFSTICAVSCLFLFSISVKPRLNLSFLSPRLLFNIYVFHVFVGMIFWFIIGPVQYLAILTFATTFAVCQLSYLAKKYISAIPNGRYVVPVLFTNLTLVSVFLIYAIVPPPSRFVGAATLDSLRTELTSINNLMIVAHPDDESLWGGAELLNNDYLVVCITNGENKTRSAEFARAMEFTSDKFIMFDYFDNRHFAWSSRYGSSLRADLADIIKLKPWDKIVTHNPEGEYGHIQHRFSSRYVTYICNGANMLPNLYYFGKYYNSAKQIVSKGLSPTLSPETADLKTQLLSLYKSQAKTVKKLSHMIPYEVLTNY